jgi:CDR ABC transporter
VLALQPLTFSTYGLTVSQLGDVQDTFVQEDGTTTTLANYIDASLGFKYSFLGYCILIICCYCIFFRIANAAALRFLNFQTR